MSTGTLPNDLDPANIRILVLDDNPHIRDIFGSMLQSAGYQVTLADSGQVALNHIDQWGPPDLAIVDLNMPGMSGFEFCERVQKRHELPVIFMTVADDQGSIVRGLDQYAEDYIIKPASTAQLLSRVLRVLRRLA